MGSPSLSSSPSLLLLLFFTPALLLTVHPVFTPSPPPPTCGPGQSWAVRLHADSDTEDGPLDLDLVASRVARQAGLENRGQIGQLEGHYLLCAWPRPRPGSGDEPGAGVEDQAGPVEGVGMASPAEVLASHPHVLWHSQEQVLSRSKRSVAFNDPRYPKQWHLHNDLREGMDINVTGVWEYNITGSGVTVVVVDDGVEHTLQDIQPNYSPEGSYDLNSNDPDPMPHPDAHSDNHHGTRCAGEIAAVPNNSFCAVGVAYGSKVAGIRVLDGPLTDSMEAVAFNKHYQVNDVYSCSWGPDDDGRTVDGPHPLGKAALQHGVIAGRRGFGSIFVVASGNGGQYSDNCNYDGYANSIYTITIGAVDEDGRMPFYAEECASMLAVTFSSGGVKMRSIYDTRADWKVNGAGFHHSHKHGFGLLNAWRLVNAAKVWESVPFLVSYASPVLKKEEPILTYPNKLALTWNVTADDLSQSGMQTLEHVSVTVTIAHPCRGNVEVVLLCPSGMTSLIGARRVIDRDPSGYQDWTFSTVRCWGERAEGQYTLLLSDYRDPSSQVCSAVGILQHWKLTLYGSSLAFSQVKDRQRLVEEAMGGQYLDSSFSLPCPPGLDIPAESISPFTSNSLKSLLLLGCFALFWSLYYTLEVTLAHLDLRQLCVRGWGPRGGRGARRRGDPEGASSDMEQQAGLDSEVKVPLVTGDNT
ncbi:proprotein convertase subtilisin/kexin type 7 isoform X2 [Osmerus eperlanus]|uniref:proprotein convertase subtilisin/kexin type 7 isoform X2 n=1 Tax=Osmerus eperlanus TaxID=29151 RepID=UPI002E160F25